MQCKMTLPGKVVKLCSCTLNFYLQEAEINNAR